MQGSGSKPEDGQPVTRTHVPDFEDFGIGCFLLAAAEVYQLGDVDLNTTDPSRLDETSTTRTVMQTEYYSINGTRLPEIDNGVTIVKRVYSDGTVEYSKCVTTKP